MIRDTTFAKVVGKQNLQAKRLVLGHNEASPATGQPCHRPPAIGYRLAMPPANGQPCRRPLATGGEPCHRPPATGHRPPASHATGQRPPASHATGHRPLMATIGYRPAMPPANGQPCRRPLATGGPPCGLRQPKASMS